MEEMHIQCANFVGCICVSILQKVSMQGKKIHDYHDTCLFGLVQSDNHIGQFKKKEWAFPSASKAKENMKKLSSLSADV